MTNYRIESELNDSYYGPRYPLGRHVNHDPRSLAYPFRAPRDVTYNTVMHQRHVPIFDQGQLGSCTGNAAIGCMGTGVLYDSLQAQGVVPFWPLNEGGAVQCYEAATQIDPFDGAYPPDDTGSDGNSVAMALKNAEMISGYTHALSFDAAMAALQKQPCIFGLNWYEDMFTPASDGLLSVTGALAGGHEVVLSGYDATMQRVRIDNSWAESWGVNGSAFLKVSDFKKLLKQDGDVTVFVPLTQPTPTPTPTPPAPGNDVTAQQVANYIRDYLKSLNL